MSDRSSRQFVRWGQEDGVATLIVERPPLNPLSFQTKEEIGACLEEIVAERGVRCLAIYGAGGRASRWDRTSRSSPRPRPADWAISAPSTSTP